MFGALYGLLVITLLATCLLVLQELFFLRMMQISDMFRVFVPISAEAQEEDQELRHGVSVPWVVRTN